LKRLQCFVQCTTQFASFAYLVTPTGLLMDDPTK